MSRNFHPLPLISAQTGPDRAADPYWHFDFPTVVKENGNATHVEFSPLNPHDLLVSAGFRLQIYSRLSAKVGKTFTRFQDKCYSATWRRDGALLCAGSEEGTVRIFDTGGIAKAPIRQFNAHARPCQVSRFTPDGKGVISGGDDGIVRLWDIASGDKVSEMPVHSDYIRAGECAPNDPNIFCSGGYDNQINVLDMRASEITMSFDHGQPIESICLFPSMSLIVSTGGSLIKVWDCYQRKLLTSLSSHTKTVTSCRLNHNNTKIITAGLDKRVNVFNALDYSQCATFESDSPILSLALSNNDETLALGMAGGYVSIAQRSPVHTKNIDTYDKAEFAKYADKSKVIRPYFATANLVSVDGETEQRRKKHENKYNRLFRKFEYNKALTMALSSDIRKKRPKVLVAVLQELARRQVLHRVCAGRQESEVCSLLRFIGKHFADSNWQPILLEVLGVLIDLYSPRIGKSEQLNRIFKLLNSRLSQELKVIGECYKCIGMINSLVSRSASTLPVNGMLKE